LRRHAINEHKSVLELPGRPGCPVCAFLKNEQSSILQKGSDSPGGLCNSHAWGFAAVSDAGVSAPALLRSLEERETLTERRDENCWVCGRLRLVEDGAVSDFSSSSGRAALMMWLQQGGAFCAPHAAKLQKTLGPAAASLIDEADSRKRSELITALKALMSREEGGSSEQAGTLGRAAEYLVAQRGLPR
jgi:hypothetical protein